SHLRFVSNVHSGSFHTPAPAGSRTRTHHSNRARVGRPGVSACVVVRRGHIVTVALSECLDSVAHTVPIQHGRLRLYSPDTRAPWRCPASGYRRVPVATTRTSSDR